ncbi:hypothetical protein [Methylobacterium nigriterrae]|uniref:hypothetical protein n=1 Tax=Methylobacterium nigriterrae TaxID=3127512 RepID=UPI003013E367
MRLLALATAACLILSTAAKAEGNALYERWRTVKSSFMGGEFLLKCGNDLRIRRSWMGKIEAHFLDPTMNWKPLDVVSISDGGLEYEGLGRKPQVTIKVMELMQKAASSQVAPNKLYESLIKISPDPNDWRAISSKINFVTGSYYDIFDGPVTFKAVWQKENVYNIVDRNKIETEVAVTLDPEFVADDRPCVPN